MNSISDRLSEWRQSQGKTVQQMAGLTGIDQALISKYENGNRLPSEKHVERLAVAMDLPLQELRKLLLAEKIAQIIEYEPNAAEILIAAESRIEYLRSSRALTVSEIEPSTLAKLEELDRLRDNWIKSKPKTGIQLEKLKEYFSVQYTYDSNRIEGNTLSLQETHLVIKEGLTISGKSMREHLEAINHAHAIEWVQSLVSGKEDLNKRNVLDLHRLILRSIDQDNAGKYRQVPVRISGSQHMPPEPYLIEKLMEDFFIHYQRQRLLLHPVLLAAEMHERLVSIHPFIDGNGRTARLIMNFILLRNGYAMVILKGDEESRLEYYQALEKVQTENDPDVFYHLIIDKALESLRDHLSMV
ncbi:MAG: helix-turn-helix domain-containing protein [Saprospiraceae bacterium]|nr:helix-turn-helix domain-containing protein [Saprospiraceae bacterium]